MPRAAQTALRAQSSTSLVGNVRRFLFGISPKEVQFAQRGFPDDIAGIRERLEGIGRAFVGGYHTALEERHDLGRLNARLNAEPYGLQGFAYEGAAMGLALLDFLTRGNRWRELLDLAPRHRYLL